MLILEFKARVKQSQSLSIDEAIRTSQFVRNKALRYWIDHQGVGKYDLNKLCKQLAKNYPFAAKLNSMARQASAERAWSSISRFYENCKKGTRPAGYPKFKKNTRSVEYKTSGWKLLSPKRIKFTDGFNIGELRLIGTYQLNLYNESQIKRVRIVKRADGYYVQFCLSVDLKIETEPTGKAIGLDVGLESFYTDHAGNKVNNPRFLKKGEKRLKKLQRRLSRKKRGSSNRRKARERLARAHLKIRRQREEYAKRIARSVIHSNDVIAYEDLRVKNLVKNHCLAKAISDAAWYRFRVWLEYFGLKLGKITIAVPPAYTSQNCSECGETVKKSLSTRTHICACGCVLDRDENAARNILKIALSTTGHVGTFGLDPINAWGEKTATLTGETLLEQVIS